MNPLEKLGLAPVQKATTYTGYICDKTHILNENETTMLEWLEEDAAWRDEAPRNILTARVCNLCLQGRLEEREAVMVGDICQEATVACTNRAKVTCATCGKKVCYKHAHDDVLCEDCGSGTCAVGSNICLEPSVGRCSSCGYAFCKAHMAADRGVCLYCLENEDAVDY